MSLNSVQVYLKTTLDGLSTTGFTPCVAIIHPPVVDNIVTEPHIYIWGSRGHEERFTLGRGRGGQKIVSHMVDMWPMVIIDAADAAADELFPLVLDGIMDKLRTISLPVDITDPTSGIASVIQNVGEQIDWEYTTPVTISESLMLYSALLTVHVDEIFLG